MLIITLGDPRSINVELVHRCRAELQDISQKFPVVFIGSKHQWKKQTSALKFSTFDFSGATDFQSVGTTPGLHFFDVDQDGKEELSEIARGTIAIQSLEKIKSLPKAMISKSAIVTLGVDKKVIDSVTPGFKGQTEFFEKAFGDKTVMILAGSRLRVGLVTNHLRLKDVSSALTPDLIETKLKLFAHSLQSLFGIKSPRIAVCGLNPHCSDQGLFGDEEEKCIVPAIHSFKKRAGSAVVEGPLPADTVFYKALEGLYDGVLAMYHDQGLGPLKTIHFSDAINVSGGLPILRASVDHGPAEDIYLSHKANPSSFLECLRFAKSFLERVNT